jgi:hypothetical protein
MMKLVRYFIGGCGRLDVQPNIVEYWDIDNRRMGCTKHMLRTMVEI